MKLRWITWVCGAFAVTAAFGTPVAGAQSSFITNIVYASHDTPDRAQARLACDSPQNATNCHIHTMNTDGVGRALTSGVGASDLDPAVSPDGTRIAFARAVGGPQGQYDIYAMNANGANVERLTTGLRDERYPAWSPDGTKIAFRGYPVTGGALIFTMNPDGSGQTTIKNTGGGDQPTYSPDGTRIAYTGTYQSGTDPVSGQPIVADDIFVQTVNAGNADMPNNLTNDPQLSDRYPSWQPTAGSSQILYRKVQPNGRELWRVDANDETTRNISVPATGSIGRAASWSPDGASAAFVSYVDAEHDQEIWLGNVFTNTINPARQLTNNGITDDEPKITNVPAALSAVPRPTGRGQLSLGLVVPKQKLGRRKALRAYARCNVKCSVSVTGATKMKVGTKRRTLRLLRTKKTLTANVRTRLKLRIPRKTLRHVRTALRRHRRVTFRISATARTAAGERTRAPVRRKLTLRR